MKPSRRKEEKPEEAEIQVWPHLKTGYFHKGDSIVKMPEGWVFVASGDMMLTRRLKAGGEYWAVMGKYKNHVNRVGLCVPSTLLEQVKTAIAEERKSPSYAKQREYQQKRRDAQQSEYEKEFNTAVRHFLSFKPAWSEYEELLARLVTAHAIPIASGTVARTELIPVEERAEAAVIAWMRHNTTGYERMHIPRIRGKRREVRRELAHSSREQLRVFRETEELKKVSATKLYKFLKKKKEEEYEAGRQ